MAERVLGPLGGRPTLAFLANAMTPLTTPSVDGRPGKASIPYSTVVGIDATSLTPWGTKIPDEPSYVILNTAISTSWGFPNPPWGYALRHASCVVRFV